MEKIILFYKFVPVADAPMCVLWQTELCKRLGLYGRIIISPHGINGTLGGPVDDLLQYKRAMNDTDHFRGIDYKWTAGRRDDFPKLSVKARPELVAFGQPDLITVDDGGVVGGGIHLKPRQLNELIAERGEDVVFFDGRNAYEAHIGKFDNAIVPEVDTTHDFIRALDDDSLAEFKDRPIVTYCTGGIRCEVISAAMKDRGFNEVYQLDGGIVKYVEKYGETGHWKGSLYTFDKRMVIDFGQEASTLGRCDTCGVDEKVFVNCTEPPCKKRFLRCDSCCQTDQHCVEHQSEHRHLDEVVLPDGTAVWAASIATASDRDDASMPDFGLYFDEAWAPPWPHTHVDWPDYGLPTDIDQLTDALVQLLQRAVAGERVEIGCIGGHGRTGTALSMLARQAGLRPEQNAVEWVRDSYCEQAVETEEQAELAC